MDTVLPLRSPVTRILIARGLRAFGDGFVSLLLPLYLLELGFGPLQVGIIATATLCGSGLLTLAVGLRAHRYHYRTLLLAAAALMAATGLAFRRRARDFWPLLVIAHRRNAQSVERRRQRVPAARARGAVARRRRPRAHRRVRALQPCRRARRRVRARSRRRFPRRSPGDRRSRSRAALQAMFVLYARAGRAGRARLPRPARRRHGRRVADASRRCANRSARSMRWRRCSASMRSAAASSSSRWSRCGSSSASTCRSRRRARSSSGPACSPRSRTSSRCASPTASASSTRWSSRTCRRTCA